MILPELSSFDVLGANGCDFPTPICNLLVEYQLILLDDDTIKMRFDQFSPEGFGIGHCKTLPPCQMKIWIFSVLEQTSGIVLFDKQSTWQVVEKSSFNQRPNHALEPFGGAMSGWKAAGNFLSTAFDQQWETIAVEQQLEVAMSYAITYNTGLSTPTVHLPRDFFCKHIPSWMICADVRDHSWYPLVAEWGVDALLLSPQCQPWSGASTSPGLVRLDGKLSALVLLLCRWFRQRHPCRVLDFSSRRYGGAMTNSAPTEDAVNADAVAWALASMAFVFLTTVLFGYSFGILVRVVSMAIVSLIWVVFGFAGAFGEYVYCLFDEQGRRFTMTLAIQPLSLGIDIVPLQAIPFAFTFEPMEMDWSRELFRDFWCPLCHAIVTVILQVVKKAA